MLKRLRRHIIPSPASLAFVWFGLGVFLVSGALSIFFSIMDGNLYSFLVMSSFFTFPGVALMLIIAAWRESRAASRAILMGGVTLSMGLSVIAFTAGSYLQDDSGTHVWMLFFCCCSPIYLIPGGLTLIFAVKSWSQLRQAIKADRAQRTRELLSARGEASFTEIADELGITAEQVKPLLHEWVDEARMFVTIDAVHRRVYTPIALIEKRRQLEAIVLARGQIHLSDLENELLVPGERLHRWVRQLARKDSFSGFINWDEGLLFSLEVDQLKDREHCPHCGGETRLAGKGVIRCRYCGVEIFLPRAALAPPKEAAQKIDDQRQEAPGLLFGEPQLGIAAARRTPFQRLRQLFMPHKKALTMVVLAMVVFLLGGACSLTFFFLGEFQTMLNLSLTLLSTMLLPIVALMLVAAAFMDQRNPPRTIISMLATLVISLAGLLLIILMSIDPEAGLELGITSTIMLVIPIFFIFSLPVVYFGLKTWPEVQAVLRLKSSQRVLRLIQVRGAISFVEISQVLDIPYDQVDDLVDDLLRSGDLYGTMDAQRGWVYTAQNLEEKRSQLLENLHMQGQFHLDQIARQLEIPLALLQDLIYQLVQAHQFIGYLNWEEGLLYSVAAEKLGAESRCPHCGGELKLQGEIIECHHCGSEILRG